MKLKIKQLVKLKLKKINQNKVKNYQLLKIFHLKNLKKLLNLHKINIILLIIKQYNIFL